jgi:hypothetical protein
MIVRRLVGTVTIGAIAPLLALSAPAMAAQVGSSSVTAHASDDTPGSGETFIVHGRYIHDSVPAADHAVKIQTYRNGGWEDIDGVRVRANDSGKYRLRVILFTVGVRDLRAVGIAGDGLHNSYDRFEVQVH